MSQVPKSALIGEVKIFKLVDMFVVGRASFWYALPPPALRPVTRSPNIPPPIAQFSPVHPLSPSSTGATRGHGDSLRRSIDEFLSQVMLLTDEE